MGPISEIVTLLRDVLQLPASVALEESTPLLGELPELDSMAVVNVLAAIEDQFDIEIDDDDISASVFETVGSLVTFVRKSSSTE